MSWEREATRTAIRVNRQTTRYFFLAGSLDAGVFNNVAVREMPPTGGVGFLDCFGFFASLLLRS